MKAARRGPDGRSGGLGRGVMRAAERWRVARGDWKLQLPAGEDNVAARRFYGRLGYRDAKTVCVEKVIGKG